MSTTLDRLRRLHGLRERKISRDPETPSITGSTGGEEAWLSLADAEPGEALENDVGAYYLVKRAIPVQLTRGPHLLSSLFSRLPAVFSPSYPKYALNTEHRFQRAAFIDTETTGLGTGAGVYCFMIGVGTFETIAHDDHTHAHTGEPSHFVVRQFFMRNPAEEGAVLSAVAQLLAACELSVTFNGRSFDLPLLRARYRQNRHRLPLNVDDVALLHDHAPHLDLLHPARRLWKRRLGSCRLLNLEQQILRVERTEQDVPGHMIPMLYTDFVRTGNALPMSRVFYHNREDIISMVGLAAQLAQAYDHAAVATRLDKLHPLDCVAVAESMESANAVEDAELAYRHSLSLDLPTGQRARIFARLGRLLKRQERWDDAVELWQLWLTTIPGPDPEPFIELAKYCEWQVQDLEQAEMWTAWAIHNLETDTSARRSTWQTELQHRLHRIQRKRNHSNTS